MRKLLLLFAAAGLVAFTLLASTALAGGRNFAAHLSGDEETPAVDTNATGQAIFHVSKDGESVEFKLIASNIEGVTVSHIHCGGEGVAGPPIVFLLPAQAPADNNGILATGSFTAADVIARPDSAACPGGVADLDDVLEKMASGGAYVNVHTSANSGGEIRGQIK